jgi:hypothetical protein
MRKTYKVILPTLEEASYELVRFRESIQLILDSGVTISQLSRSLGVERYLIYVWRDGRWYPKNPLIYRTISLWGDKIRAGEAPRIELVSV